MTFYETISFAQLMMTKQTYQTIRCYPKNRATCPVNSDNPSPKTSVSGLARQDKTTTSADTSQHGAGPREAYAESGDEEGVEVGVVELLGKHHRYRGGDGVAVIGSIETAFFAGHAEFVGNGIDDVAAALVQQ